jgi:RNA polymerase sigma-70 factor, ECF subfamily
MRSSPAPELVEAAIQGGPPEVERLIEAVWPDAYRLAYAILAERQSAEDVAQESCVIIYRTIGSLRAAAAFGVWFYRIVVRRATEAKKRRNRIDPVITDTTVAEDCTATIDIWRALASLPADLRDVVVLHYFEDLSSREIAAILRIPDGTVRFRLMTAKRRLRPLLDHASPVASVNHEVHPHAI